ncbi:chalcone isomerase family protein [Parasulfuritortus cantonensis]|uniref:chalcone isomerase family protein n=1 Tax=Parasulfuritortus cantonensis TaxID=2528202 RepID=UPI001404B779|nr:chalcone isomerase family protein [Parasulfuritortus cantonensis]
MLGWRLLAGACLVFAAPAAAQDASVAGLNVPERADLAGHDLLLNGAGLRSILGFRIYVAALYLPDRAASAGAVLGRDTPRRLDITLLRDVGTERNLAALKDGLVANNSEADMAAIEGDLEHFFALLRQARELPAGTRIRFDYLPGEGTRVWVGEREFGRIPGARFELAILRIWLGDEPIQVSLKKALLGDRPT